MDKRLAKPSKFSEVLGRSEKRAATDLSAKSADCRGGVAMDEAQAATVSRKVMIGDRFEEARELLRRESYHLPQTPRRSRGNTFVKALDPVTGGHKRSQ